MKTFLADNVKITTTLDKGARITFETGEYEVDSILEVFKLSKDIIAGGSAIKVTVERE